MPKLSLNSNFYVELPLDGSDRDNEWARGTLDLVIRVNEMSTSTVLIDTVGIQSHLWRIYEATATPTVIPSSSPTPDLTPIPPSGSPDGLRSILEVFRDEASVEVRITELDVAIMRRNWQGFYFPEEVVEYYSDQAQLFRDVIHQCLYDESGAFAPICKEITFWAAFDTDDAYNRCFYATLFSPSNRIHPDCTYYTPTPTPGPSPTATSTFDPTATTTPVGTPLPIPTYFIVKEAHYQIYKELEAAPAHSTPTPGGPTPTPTQTPMGAYPPPLPIPTPEPTMTFVSYP